MYNLVVTDLDGTLLNIDHKVDDFTKNIINTLYNNGVNIVIATGRSFYDAIRVKEQLGINIPMITTNGASLYDSDNKELFRYLLPEKVASDILNMDYKKYGKNILINIICDEKWIVNEDISKTHIINEWSEPTWSFEKVDKKDVNTKGITKFFFFGTHEELLKIEKHILDNYSDVVNCAFTLPICFEVFSKKATKGQALLELAKLKNYDLNRAIAFGDGFNDVEMLKEVKKGYIMGNATDKLKEKYSELEVIGDNSNSSVAKKLKEVFKL